MPNVFRASKEFRFLYRAWRYRWKVERAEIDFVLRELSPGDTCLDIGGHKGAFTYWMQRKVGAAGHVYTFEPQPELAEYLMRVRKRLGLGNVTIEHAAASSTRGDANLYRESQTPSPSATLERDASDAIAMTTRVRTIRLDDYLKNSRNRPVRFIKCDVEGHELDVFQGATEILRKDKPVLLFECEQRHQPDRSIVEIFNFLEQLGYAGAFFQRGQLKDLSYFQPKENIHGQGDYVYNFVFRPKANLKSATAPTSRAA